MWLSKQIRRERPESEADLGVTTISADRSGVLSKGEVRDLPIYGPGGYFWRPGNGESVLVIKGGPGGEESCIAGAAQAESGIEPGEILIRSAGGASLRLRNNGSIEVKGTLSVTGSLMINGKPCQVEQCGQSGL